MKKEKSLIISSVLIVFAMFVVGNLCSSCFDAKQAYFILLGTYWLTILLATLIFSPSFFDTNLYRNDFNLMSVLAFLPLGGVLLVVFIPKIELISFGFVLLAIVTALVNGFLEERFWRGVYLEYFPKSFYFGFVIPVTLFSIWHIPLYMIDGVVYHGGYLSMVGGAIGMGVLWTIVSRKQQGILTVTVAHVIVNIFAFVPHYIDNDF